MIYYLFEVTDLVSTRSNSCRLPHGEYVILLHGVLMSYRNFRVPSLGGG